MNNDNVWQGVRYLLIAGGAYLAGRGKLDPAQVAPLVDDAMTAGGAVVSAGTALWGFYVKWRTRAVPQATGARPDVPTVNAATGAIEH